MQSIIIYHMFQYISYIITVVSFNHSEAPPSWGGTKGQQLVMSMTVRQKICDPGVPGYVQTLRMDVSHDVSV